MKITFGGSRGTRPLHEERFSRYGGATTSVMVQGQAGEMIIIDCGSGLANLETEILGSEEPLLMLFTHLHIDHMLGLPSFRGLHQEGRQISLAGPEETAKACRGLFSTPYWPLDLDSLPADIHDLQLQPILPGNETNPSSNDTLSWGNLTIRCMMVTHPGGCLAFRIEEKSTGNSFLFATDIEWGLMKKSHRDRFLAFGTSTGSPTVFAMDGHVSDQEYPDRTGWGHSTQEDVVRLGQIMGSQHTLITHHSPDNDDDTLDQRLLAIKKIDNKADFIFQGMKVDLA